MRDLSKIIREFEKFCCKRYERGKPKHDPTDSYFRLSRQIVKFMVRADALNLHVNPVRMKMTGTKKIPVLHVCNNSDVLPETLNGLTINDAR